MCPYHDLPAFMLLFHLLAILLFVILIVEVQHVLDSSLFGTHLHRIAVVAVICVRIYKTKNNYIPGVLIITALKLLRQSHF